MRGVPEIEKHLAVEIYVLAGDATNCDRDDCEEQAELCMTVGLTEGGTRDVLVCRDHAYGFIDHVLAHGHASWEGE